MFSIVFLLDQNETEFNYKKMISKIAFLSQKSKKIELIFVIENNNYLILDEIQKFQNINKNVIVKFVFSLKRISFNSSIKKVNKLITNDYFLILPNYSNIDENFVETITSILNTKNVDIIEFKPNFKGLIKWKPNDRLNKSKFDKFLNISENQEIVAFTFPFVYNKIFSTSLLDKTLKTFFNDNSFDYSSILFSELIYLMFIYAKTYLYISKELIEIEITSSYIQGFNDIINAWSKIKYNFFERSMKFIDEIEYAEAFYLKIILCSIYSSTSSSKIKSLIKNKPNLTPKKYYEKLLKIESNELKDFDLKNKYMLLNNSKEVSILKQSYPIPKWNKLLKELEL